MFKNIKVKAALMLIVILFANSAEGRIQFRQGWWKAELTGGIGIDVSTEDRSGDVLVTLLAEYEFPVAGRYTLGIRIIPVLLYEPHRSESESVWGGGLGVAGRYFFHDYEYRGWFLEAGAHGVVHEGEIKANTSSINFLLGGGLGYRFFNSKWHSSLKFEHISNGGLGDLNQSLNTISLSLGYTF